MQIADENYSHRLNPQTFSPTLQSKSFNWNFFVFQRFPSLPSTQTVYANWSEWSTENIWRDFSWIIRRTNTKRALNGSQTRKLWAPAMRSSNMETESKQKKKTNTHKGRRWCEFNVFKFFTDAIYRLIKFLFCLR